MHIPRSGRKCALALIDIQKPFVKPRDRSVVVNIQKLLKTATYETYVEAVFSADPGSLWDLQMDWTPPRRADAHTLLEISASLEQLEVRRVHKHSKSIFSADKGLADFLRKKGIEEVHMVGFDINDCVLASALDCFDAGFYTYVIEECCGASAGPRLKSHALAILRHLSMTNSKKPTEGALTGANAGRSPTEQATPARASL